LDEGRFPLGEVERDRVVIPDQKMWEANWMKKGALILEKEERGERRLTLSAVRASAVWLPRAAPFSWQDRGKMDQGLGRDFQLLDVFRHP